MWLYRGAQSALFYYVSCTPCADAAYRRHRRRQASRDRAEKRALQEEQPDLYALHEHMAPFRTNPFWEEEIRLGPIPPVKRGKKTNAGAGGSQRCLTAAGTQTTTATAGSETDLVPPLAADLARGEDGPGMADWNRRRYQREDEPLWGCATTSRPPMAQSAPASRPSTANRSSNAPARDDFARRPYQHATVRAPVNPLHPPITSTSTAEPERTRWTVQPPPQAMVMAGRAPAACGKLAASESRRKRTKIVSLDESWGMDEAYLAAARSREEQHSGMDSRRGTKLQLPRLSIPSSASTTTTARTGTTRTLSSDSSSTIVSNPRRPRPAVRSSISSTPSPPPRAITSVLGKTAALPFPLSAPARAPPRLDEKSRALRGRDSRSPVPPLALREQNTAYDSPSPGRRPDQTSGTSTTIAHDENRAPSRHGTARPSRPSGWMREFSFPAKPAPSPSPSPPTSSASSTSARSVSLSAAYVPPATASPRPSNHTAAAARAATPTPAPAEGPKDLERADSGTAPSRASTEKRRRAGLGRSWIQDSSLAVLERLVDAKAAARSAFVRAPVVEARFGLPPPKMTEGGGGEEEESEAEGEVEEIEIEVEGGMGGKGGRRWSCEV